MISHIIIRSYPLHNEYSSFFPIISYFVGNSSTNFMTFLPIVVISSQIGLRVMCIVIHLRVSVEPFKSNSSVDSRYDVVHVCW